MAVTRAQKVRLGIFVGSGLVVLFGGIIVLAGMSLGEQRDDYIIKYSDSAVSLSGLEVGSPVKYSGIRVGRVDTIGIDPDDVGIIRVGISLTGGTPVKVDTQANLGSMGITGLKYIELSRGSQGAATRRPGDAIPPGSSAMDELSDQAGKIAEQVNTAITRLNAFVAPEMKDRVASVLDRTDKLLATTEATIAENREGWRTLTANLARASERFDGIGARVESLLTSIEPKLVKGVDEGARTARNLRVASGKLEGFLGEANAATKNLDKLLVQSNLALAQSRDSLVDGLADMRDAANSFRDFARRVREDPSLLIIREGGE